MPLAARDVHETRLCDHFHVEGESAVPQISSPCRETKHEGVRIWFQRENESAGSGEASLSDRIDALQHLLLHGPPKKIARELKVASASLLLTDRALAKPLTLRLLLELAQEKRADVFEPKTLLPGLGETD